MSQSPSQTQTPRVIIETFLSSVADVTHPQYGRDYLAEALKPALRLEALIRKSLSRRPPVGAHAIDPIDLQDLHLGIFDVFLIPNNIRTIQAREENTPFSSMGELHAARTTMHLDTTRFSYYSSTALALCSFPKQEMFPLRRALFRKTGVPCMVESLADFRENLKIFTHGSLLPITNWDNMVITGSAVVASLGAGCTPREGKWPTPPEINEVYQAAHHYGQSDVNVFLYGLTPEQAIAKTAEIHSAISKPSLWPFIIIRRADRISFHTFFPSRPIHVHLNIYASPADILAKCDIDCASCLYDGSTVYMNPRALVAFMCQRNTIDLQLWSPSYEVRLAKYGQRGFEVHVPFLERDKVAYGRIYKRNLKELPMGLGRLLVLELLRYIPDHLHRLNYKKAPVAKQFPEIFPDPSNFAPVDLRLSQSIDMFWAQVPYGPQWDPNTLLKMAGILDERIHFNSDDHSHCIFACNEFSESLKAVCTKCPPLPPADANTKSKSYLQSVFFYGPLQFNAIGSHKEYFLLGAGKNKTERQAKWIGETYLREGEEQDKKNFQEIPRHCWQGCVLDANNISYGFKQYLDVEGAAPTLISLFRLYAELDPYTRYKGYTGRFVVQEDFDKQLQGLDSLEGLGMMEGIIEDSGEDSGEDMDQESEFSESVDWEQSDNDY